MRVRVSAPRSRETSATPARSGGRKPPCPSTQRRFPTAAPQGTKPPASGGATRATAGLPANGGNRACRSAESASSQPAILLARAPLQSFDLRRVGALRVPEAFRSPHLSLQLARRRRQRVPAWIFSRDGFPGSPPRTGRPPAPAAGDARSRNQGSAANVHRSRISFSVATGSSSVVECSGGSNSGFPGDQSSTLSACSS